MESLESASTASKDLENYTSLAMDAVACLQQTLSEGCKTSNVDIQLMLANVQRCESIVQQLQITESDGLLSNALKSLSSSLSSHSNILNKKITQLNEAFRAGLSSTKRPALGLRSINTENFSSPDVQKSMKEGDDFEAKQHKSRCCAIEATIVRNGQIQFDDVVGLKEAKCSLQDAIIMPLVFPHLFSGGRKPWRRILLFGPPGTGKSRLAQAVSTEVKATFYSVSSTDLMSSWVGESEKMIKELFHHASNQTGPSVIFIDEIDSLCRQRNTREDEGTRRIKTELLIQMDGADRQVQDKIVLLCATNCPWDLDTAFLRRFQKRIYIPLPDHASRIQLMKLHCHGSHVNLTDDEWKELANLTEGYSGSDLATLTNGGLFQPIRDLQAANYWQETNDGRWMPCDDPMSKSSLKANITDLPPKMISPRDVNIRDFLKSLEIHRPTVSEQELHKFASFTSCYGQTG